MAENIVKGFQTDKGVELYDYNSLANKPTLVTQAQLDAVKTAANKYTDEEIAKINPGGNLSGYATQEWVAQNYQIQGEYLTSIPSSYALKSDIPTNQEILNLIISSFTNVAEVGA